ncbi:NTPase KAP family P-loop domain-containing protein 1 [Amia ocellicauda]|uniref:NTPase KAP family P-loop domain-containing protein 1 n=1 Tax=Amia ocellicauda TaxID=2972642 RepID=UPI003463AE25
MNTKELPSDEVYAYGLSKALIKVAPPATVGLYSSCPNRINMLLNRIEVHMKKESDKKEKAYKGQSKPRSQKASILNFLNLLFTLIFYWPMWTETNQNRKNVRYIFIKFSAWHFAGSDKLWAGLVIRICEELQLSFGKLFISVYRAAQYIEGDVKKIIVGSHKEWKTKKFLCIPLWLATLIIMLGILGLVALFSVAGIPSGESGKDGIAAVETLAIATLGLPAAGAVRFTLLVGKNLIFSQNLNVKRMIDNQKLSSQLGFMNEVRKEIDILSNFIRFMEVYERRKIRVVLEITNLGRCTPGMIVGVLDAISILLSSEDSPFISFLAINPSFIAKRVESSGCFVKVEKNGYAFLNQIVSLPLTVPELCNASKKMAFENIVKGQLESPEDLFLEEMEGMKNNTSCSSDVSTVERGLENDTQIPLLSSTSQPEMNIGDNEELKSLIEKALKSIYAEGNLHKYITDNSICMRRIINSVRVSVNIMAAVDRDLPPPEDIAAWVVLANQWPCRLSWILQCLEDDEQRAEIVQHTTGEVIADDTKLLWEVFSESRIELYMIRDEIASLLQQDGDPELFEKFLKIDFHFTVREAKQFRLFTVNLDHSIKKELAILLASSNLKEKMKPDALTPLPLRTVLKMSTSQVCEEMAKLKLPPKYQDAIHQHSLDGEALIYSDNSEIKQVLQMSMGEWIVFSIHFLSIKPPAVSPAPDRVLKPGDINAASTVFLSEGNLLAKATPYSSLSNLLESTIM